MRRSLLRCLSLSNFAIGTSQTFRGGRLAAIEHRRS